MAGPAWWIRARRCALVAILILCRPALAPAAPLCGQCEPVSGDPGLAVECGSERAMSAFVGTQSERFDVRSGGAVFQIPGLPVTVQGCRSAPAGGCEKVFVLSLGLQAQHLVDLGLGQTVSLSCADGLTSISYHESTASGDRDFATAGDCEITVAGSLGADGPIRGTFTGTLSSFLGPIPETLPVTGCYCSNAGDPPDLDPCDVPAVDIELTDNGHAWSTDERIPYVITVTNLGGTTASGVSVSDVVPVNTTFQESASTPGWSCAPGAGDAVVCSLEVGELAPGACRTLTFAARVDEGVDPQWDVYNSAHVVSSTPGAATARRQSPVTAASHGPSFHCRCQGMSGRCGCSCTEYAATLVDDVPCTGAGCCFLRGVAVVACAVLHGAPAVTVPRGSTQEPLVVDGPLYYAFRDRVLRSTRGGRRVTDLYYRHGAGLTQAAVTEPALIALAHAALVAWEPLLAVLVDPPTGGPGPVVVTASQVQSLVDFLDALRPVANPVLAAAIDRGRERLAPETWVGLTPEQVLARLEGLLCPEGVTFASVGCRIADLIEIVESSTTPGKTAGKLRRLLQTAEEKATEADELANVGETRRARAALKKALKAFPKFRQVVRSRRGKRELPDAVRLRLLEPLDSLQADVKALRNEVARSRERPEAP